MKSRLSYTILTFSVVIASIAIVVYKYSSGTSKLDNLWILPLTNILIFLLLTYFIKHPELLIKRSRMQIEDPDTYPIRNSIKWWTRFYYIFRLIISLVLMATTLCLTFF